MTEQERQYQLQVLKYKLTKTKSQIQNRIDELTREKNNEIEHENDNYCELKRKMLDDINTVRAGKYTDGVDELERMRIEDEARSKERDLGMRRAEHERILHIINHRYYARRAPLDEDMRKLQEEYEADKAVLMLPETQTTEDNDL